MKYWIRDIFVEIPKRRFIIINNIISMTYINEHLER